MKENAFSFKSYAYLRQLYRNNKSPLLKIVIAYKNPVTSRSVSSLSKIIASNNNKYKELAKEYLFFRLFKAKRVEDAIELSKTIENNDLVSFVLETISFFSKNPTYEEIKERNSYLCFLLYYFPYADDETDLAYSFPNDKYGEGYYQYLLLREVYGVSKLRKYVLSSFKGEKGVRSFLSSLERDALNLLFTNHNVTVSNFLEYKNIHPLYSDLKKTNERKSILERLLLLDAVEVLDNKIRILEGGIFLLGCYNCDPLC